MSIDQFYSNIKGKSESPSTKDPVPSLDTAAQVPASESIGIIEKRNALVNEFEIKSLGNGKVELVLNGLSRLEFLRKVSPVALEMHGRPAIADFRIEEWGKDESFMKKIESRVKIAINGNVENSTQKTRREQEVNGWLNADFCDVVVAHVAYYLATGRDLFKGQSVRTKGSTLEFHSIGLNTLLDRANFRYSHVGASAII